MFSGITWNCCKFYEKEYISFHFISYTDITTLYSKCDQAFHLWQQLELASELESDLQGRKWLVDFNAWKSQLVSFDRSNNTGTIDGKMERPVLEENHLLISWVWVSLLSWIGVFTLPLLLKLLPGKLETWFVVWSLFVLMLLCISINLPHGHAWNTVVKSGLVLLVANWSCWVSFKNGYAELLVLHLLL